MSFWKNKNILISGGTAGLGRALAVELHGRGARVAVFARNPEGVARVRRELPGVHAFVADVADKNAIPAIALEASNYFGSAVHVLVNNASALGATPLRPLLDTDCEDFARVLETNLLGPFRLTKAVAGGMLLRGEGWIVNISSDAAVNAYPNWGAYSVSKAALDHLTRVQNAELREAGLRSLSVDPGDMRTGLHFAAVPDANPAALKDPALAARQFADFIERDESSAERVSI